MKEIYSLAMIMIIAVGGLFAQRTITGTVTDPTGDPLIGATVVAKGTTTGTVTDIDGGYSIQLPSGVSTLIFSYTGFRTTEVEVGASNVVDVSLEQDITQLSEVIVVGYGTQIKSTLTGNIAKVGGDEIQSLPVPSVEQALQGRSAGVFVEAVNGKPGGAIRVRVRGASSITASNQPLYVIDGIPLTTQSQNESGAPINPLADINFNDVESIEILKDASAAAIYGSRAANGVVLITTKQGKEGKTRVEANFQGGVSEASGRREFIDAGQFVQLFQRAGLGAARYEWANGLEGWESEQEAIDWWQGFVEGRLTRYSGFSDWRTLQTNTDWQDLAFRQASNYQATVSASGGNDRTRFYASGNWTQQEGILVANAFERLSGRLNLDQKASDRFNFGINMSLARTAIDQVSDDNQFSTPLQLIALAPITPPRDEDGVLYDRPTTTYYNGLIDTENAQRGIVNLRTLANAYGRYQLAKGLMLNGEAGVDLFTVRDNAFYGRRTIGGQGTNGYGTSRYAQVANWTSKLFLNYNTSLNGTHNFDVTAGTEFQKSRTDRTEVEGQEFPLDDLRTIASAAEIASGSSDITEFSFLSYFGRINYNFNRKYLLTVSGRVDGSSRFGRNNRYGFFPAVSAGWVLSEEGFLSGSRGLSFLKLRASYGLTGNAEIDNFNQLGLFGAEGYNGASGLKPSQIPNPDLAWERTAQFDIGVDFGLFDNRLNGEIDYYQKRTTDLLLDVPVPGTAGFRTQTRNIGKLENRGVELVLNANILTGAFKWNLGLNMARNINEVLELAEGQTIIDAGSSRFMNVVKVGEPIGVFHGAEYAGVDPATGDALWYLNTPGQERETTNNFGDAEFVSLGSPVPDVIGGVTNNFSWNGLSLDVMFQGVFGNEIHNGAGSFMSCNACWFDNQTLDQMRYWDQPGDQTDVPEPRLGYSNGDQSRSSRFLSDGSYVRLRTATLAYEFPRNLIGRFNLTRLRLYATGQNLLTFTKYEGWDPEVSTDFAVDNVTSGVDFYAAPQPRTIVFGINVGF